MLKGPPPALTVNEPFECERFGRQLFDINISNIQDRQAHHVAKRFRLKPALAAVVAGHAFAAVRS